VTKRVDAREVNALVVTGRFVQTSSEQDGGREDDDDEERAFRYGGSVQWTLTVTGGLMT
jgi:hypothetical protein